MHKRRRSSQCGFQVSACGMQGAFYLPVLEEPVTQTVPRPSADMNRMAWPQWPSSVPHLLKSCVWTGVRENTAYMNYQIRWRNLQDLWKFQAWQKQGKTLGLWDQGQEGNGIKIGRILRGGGRTQVQLTGAGVWVLIEMYPHQYAENCWLCQERQETFWFLK